MTNNIKNNNLNLLIKIFLAVLAGFLLVYSLPNRNLNFNLGFLAWFGITLLILNIRLANSKKESFYITIISSILYYSTIYLWTNRFGVYVWLLASIFFGSLMGLWGIAVYIFEKNQPKNICVFLIPTSLVIFEHLKTFGILGTNWGSLSYLQYKDLYLIQIAGLLGMYSITFIMALFGYFISEIIINYKKTPILETLKKYIFIPILIICVYIYGFLSINLDKSNGKNNIKPIKVALLQPSFDMLIKKDSSKTYMMTKTLYEMTKKIVENDKDTDLIVWPESSLPGLNNNPYVTGFMENLAKETNTNIIYGVISLDEENKKHNSAVYYNNEGKYQGLCSKKHLVPFGEYVPISNKLRKVHPLLSLVPEYEPGDPEKDKGVFEINGTKFGIIVCFDSNFQHYVKESVKNGANFVTIITNDGWFENYDATEDHISWNVIRAVENRVPILQSANTGISAVIDKYGRVTKRIGVFQRGYISDDIKITKSGSLYTKIGNIFTYLSYLFLLLCIADIINKKKYMFKNIPCVSFFHKFNKNKENKEN